MVLIWIFAVVFFGASLVYSWAFYKDFNATNHKIEAFMNSHHQCSIWYASIYFYILSGAALILLGLALGVLFTEAFDPSPAYALILFGLALLVSDMALKLRQDQCLVFYSKGFVWQGMIFPYRSIQVENHQIIQETPIPLNSLQVKAIEQRYQAWASRRTGQNQTGIDGN